MHELNYFTHDHIFVAIGYRVEMLDIKSGQWIEITFVEGYEPRCSLGNILYGIM